MDTRDNNLERSEANSRSTFLLLLAEVLSVSLAATRSGTHSLGVAAVVI